MSAAWLAAIVALGCVGVLLLRGARAKVHRLERGLAEAGANLARLEQAFARFAPEDVVEHIAGGAEVVAEVKDVTVMFADIRGFTPLSEKVDPKTMVGLLNGYFAAMNRAIAENRGRVSRIMGDGLLALFGALERNPWHPADAVRAALAMRVALSQYNADLATRKLAPLAFGVGLHRGDVVAGVMGSHDLMEYTVIGDVVNTAARVESLTRSVDADILITSDVRRDLDPRFKLREMPPLSVKGKSEPILTFAVESYDET